jgi:Undecaprenyl-phosphate glucose phosphotransferase
MVTMDVVTVGAVWIASYWLRFYLVPWHLTKGIPDLDLYLWLSLLVIPVAIFSMRVVGLYSSYRVRGLVEEFFDVLQAVVLTVIVVAVTSFFYREYSLSRMVIAVFGALSIAGLTATRVVLRSLLRYLRSKGLNQRHVLIIGAGPLGRSLAEKMIHLSHLGLSVAGFLDDGHETGEEILPGVPLLGNRKDLERVFRECPVDQVYIALPRRDHRFAEEALELLSSRMVDIKIVPDYLQFVALRSSVDDFDGTPVINLSEKPLWGPKALLKRGFDFVFSLLGLVLLSPLLALIALLVKATSPGPVFYRQERVGYDGQRFQMVKFRSMRVDGDDAGDTRWTVPDDPRRTPLGRILRRLSLDELPQLWNILKGEMSFVGPRPERSFYVKKFSDRDPRYMWRHRVKAGLTGWAQVNGLRGDTSIEERTEYDLFYVRNWSFRLDLKIITLTLMRVLFDRHAY